MNIFELIAGIIGTAMESVDEEVTEAIIEHSRDYGHSWIVSLYERDIKPTWRNNWSTTKTLQIMRILYADGHFFIDDI